MLARLRYTTLNPYLHRDVLLERIMDSEKRYNRLASSLKSRSVSVPSPELVTNFDSLLADLGDIEQKIRTERRRRTLRILWPTLTLVSFAGWLIQVVLRATDAGLIAFGVVTVGLVAIVLVAVSNVLLAFFRIATRRAKIFLVGLPIPIALALSIATFVTALQQGQPYGLPQVTQNVALALLFYATMVLNFLRDTRKLFVEAETRALVQAYEGPD